MLVKFLSFFTCLFFLMLSATSFAVVEGAESAPTHLLKTTTVVNTVDVKPVARDTEIAARIKNILISTQWFENINIEVKNGIVFIKGTTSKTDFKNWAENLATKTQDVVAVVNQLEVVGPSMMNAQWSLLHDLKNKWHHAIQSLPIFIFSIFIMVSTGFFARFMSMVVRKSLLYRQFHPLLADVFAKGAGFVCFLIGLYLILQLLGLTTVALTILGGTGVVGIVLGIAFKNITENLLASILLSIQRPFQNNDLIEVAGVIGYVQALTIRATLLITPEGNHVQVPNAIVYQSNISNFTINPKRRECFSIEISSQDSISTAQHLALETLQQHPAILKDPLPLILVDDLSSGVVTLKIYFWLDSQKYQWEKVKSAAIRLVKTAFQKASIMPGAKSDSMEENEGTKPNSAQEKNPSLGESNESKSTATNAEGNLHSELSNMKKQVRESREVEKGVNLLSKEDEVSGEIKTT